MRKFVIKTVAFAGLYASLWGIVVCFHMFVIGNQNEQSQIASIVDKSDRLISMDQPCVVLLGNSNVRMGFQSELIEQELGMPVVNMGLTSLGNSFLENLSKLNPMEGGLFVVCHTDFGDDDTLTHSLYMWTVVEFHMRLWPLLRWKDWAQISKAYPEYFYQKMGHRYRKQGTRKRPITIFCQSVWRPVL